ncbi:arsenic resistance N-acetyltransferase ArsN2 [Rudanella lutea]|uniref:arsenic resistance N-acetyltransferase ArsN2 n=1 Tax=Rudanella lutea TaxID=451374 RepID=UPI0003755451|nr:arsenic resistance N-acetyltransferase ArsN2 [Rudanella lutea]
MSIHYTSARLQDRAEIAALLEEVRLIADDLPEHLSGFVLAREGDQLVGVAGLESFGEVALLRSVAVKPTHRGRQIAEHLLEQLLEMAQSQSIAQLYLITTTAEDYFAGHGFSSINRQSVPLAVQQSAQFSSLCPASAAVMHRSLPILAHE